jgi:glycosyltransferase involved in cell wall biosynthesis
LADPRLSRFDLVTISRGQGVTHQWHRRRVWSQLLACDIAVLPSAETDWYQAKPNTRMIMFKALGIPIVASPLASYVATLNHGRSCYFVRTPEEWADALLALSDRDHRRAIGLAERENILAKYGTEANGQEWLALFRRLAEERDTAGR